MDNEPVPVVCSEDVTRRIVTLPVDSDRPLLIIEPSLTAEMLEAMKRAKHLIDNRKAVAIPMSPIMARELRYQLVEMMSGIIPSIYIRVVM
jgi:hypothetical protein